MTGNPLPLEASLEDLRQCQFSAWFPTFRHLKEKFRGRTNVTIQSQVIKGVPDEFTDFLQCDGIRLPQGATRLSSCAPNELPRRDSDDEGEWNTAGNDGNDSDKRAPQQYSFPELNRQITDAIEVLGGSVIPKLNWSTPKDATWVNEGTLKCKTPGDVYLLLKSSDFCMHDLQTLQQQHQQQSQQLSEAPPSQLKLELVLRKWCNFYPSMEFRCFVRNHTLIGMSQRVHTQHYPHLLQDRDHICSLIEEFFDDVICHQFANNLVPSYVFDIYVDKSDRVWLLDFNVWSIQTDALLYTWEELIDLEIPLHDDNFPELRLVETALEVRQDPLSSYRAPMDTVELAGSSSGGGAGMDATTFESFMAMCQKPSERNGQSSSDSEEGDDP